MDQTIQANDKVCTMREAIAAGVHDGDTVAITGFTHLICFAAGHEIIRQKKRDLVAVRLTPDLVYEQMIQAGCIQKLIFSWAGNPGVGSLHALRRRVEARYGQAGLELEEYSHFGLNARFLAASKGLPFYPIDNYQGSDIPAHNPNIKTVTCPFTDRKLAAVAPLNPDVAIVHCQRADAEGNAQVWGLFGSQREIALSSKRVIVVCEEIVDTAIVRSDPNRTLLPGIIVDCVVEEPWGCHPSYAQGHYDRDNDFYVAWDEISRDEERFDDYLDEFVYGVKDRTEYLERLGRDCIARLTPDTPRPSGSIDYGY